MAFADHERVALLSAPRLGPVVLHRLEAIGVDSIAKLKALGPDTAVRIICEQMGTMAWANRRRPLRRLCQELDIQPLSPLT